MKKIALICALLFVTVTPAATLDNPRIVPAAHDALIIANREGLAAIADDLAGSDRRGICLYDRCDLLDLVRRDARSHRAVGGKCGG